MAGLQFIDNSTQDINNGNYSVGIFLEISKAFDMVDHKFLLSKLSHYGARGGT